MTHRPETLDLRRTGDEPATRLLETAFEQLRPGQGLELLLDHEPGELLEHLRGVAPGAYEWWPLELGDAVWRVLVARRQDSGTPMGPLGLFTADHQRMRELQERALEQAKGGDRRAAAQALAELKVGLERHTRAEEELLFPLLRNTGHDKGAADVDALLAEHAAIGKRMQGLDELLGCEERFDQPELVRRLEELTQTIRRHEAREEAAVLPVCEWMLSQQERQDLVEEAQRN